MLKLTLEETIAAHREMWNWLAENPAAKKEEYPPFKESHTKGLYAEIPLHVCFICEYAAQQAKELLRPDYYCDYCPLDWDVFKNITSYMCEESFYGEWQENHTFDPCAISPAVYKTRLQIRKQLAETIAGLPKKKE